MSDVPAAHWTHPVAKRIPSTFSSSVRKPSPLWEQRSSEISSWLVNRVQRKSWAGFKDKTNCSLLGCWGKVREFLMLSLFLLKDKWAITLFLCSSVFRPWNSVVDHFTNLVVFLNFCYVSLCPHLFLLFITQTTLLCILFPFHSNALARWSTSTSGPHIRCSVCMSVGDGEHEWGQSGCSHTTQRAKWAFVNKRARTRGTAFSYIFYWKQVWWKSGISECCYIHNRGTRETCPSPFSSVGPSSNEQLISSEIYFVWQAQNGKSNRITVELWSI